MFILISKNLFFIGRLCNLNNQNSNERDEVFLKWMNDIPNEKTRWYIQERVIKQMDWYRTKSAAYKIQYLRWTTGSIIISGVIPIASVLADGGLLGR